MNMLMMGGGGGAGRSMVLLGDSITLANGVEPSDKGYFNWTNTAARQLWDVAHNAGVGGDSTTQMLARVNADVIDRHPAWCMVLGGVNDVAADTAAETTIANLIAIYERLRAAKIQVIASTLPPSTSFNTAPRTTAWQTINQALRDYAAAHSWLVFGDAGPTYHDTGSAYAVPLAGYTADGVHPNALGASAMGLALWAAISGHASVRRIPAYGGLAIANADTGRIYYVAANQLMTGSATDHITAPATGVHASNWFISGGGTWSKVARSDGLPGTWQQCAIGAESDAATFSLPDRTANWAVGETWFAQIEFETDDDWVSPSNFELYLGALNSSNTVLAEVKALGHSVGGGSGSAITRPTSGILRTPNLVIPATTAKLRPYLTVGMVSGTLRVCRYENRRV